jgi:ferritin
MPDAAYPHDRRLFLLMERKDIMLKKEISELINTQVNKEFYSAYLYLDFANFFHDKGLDGFANWYEIQAQEERDHAMLMRQYLINNGDTVTFDEIAKPDIEKKDTLTVLKAALNHEQYVTSLINKIYAAADAEKDYRTMQFLDWFVKEQGEEEKNADDMIKKFELYGTDAKGLYALNQELLGRVYTAPSLVL